MAPVNPDLGLQAEGTPTRSRIRPWSVIVQMWRQVVAEPIAEGRLRDVGWPSGLRVIVIICHVALGLTTTMVLAAEPLRQLLPLGPVSDELSMPRPMVWVLTLLIGLCLTLFLLACTHGPTWLLVLGLVIGIPAQLMIGLYPLITSGGLSLVALVIVALVVAVTVLMLVWRRRGLGPHHFTILYGLVLAQAVVATVDATRQTAPLGFDVMPGVIALQIVLLAPLTTPMVFAAGTAPAEVSVTLSLRTASVLGRRSRRSVTYTVMVAALVLGLGQSVWQVVQLRGPDLAWQTVTTTVAVVGAWVLVGVLVGRRRRWRSDRVADTGGSLGLPAGVVVAGAALPVVVLLGVLMLLTTVIPALDWSFGLLQSGTAIGLMRVAALLVAVIIALVSLRRGHPVRALVLLCAAVPMVPVAVTVLTSPDRSFSVNVAVVTAALVTTLAGWAVTLSVRSRLTETRAVGILALTVLCLLVPHRTILAEPLEFLLGDGVGLVLLGLWWQLLTASEIANRDSRRFGLTSRVLLLLTANLLTTVVLAHHVLTRQPAVGGMQSSVAFGDQTLGLGILAAAAIAVVADIGQDRLPSQRPISASQATARQAATRQSSRAPLDAASKVQS